MSSVWCEAIFYFGDIVVVNNNQIGCVVKTWKVTPTAKGYKYEVYVRCLNAICEFPEELIQRYIVSKEISEEEQAWHCVIQRRRTGGTNDHIL